MTEITLQAAISEATRWLEYAEGGQARLARLSEARRLRDDGEYAAAKALVRSVGEEHDLYDHDPVDLTIVVRRLLAAVGEDSQ